MHQEGFEKFFKSTHFYTFFDTQNKTFQWSIQAQRVRKKLNAKLLCGSQNIHTGYKHINSPHKSKHATEYEHLKWAGVKGKGVKDSSLMNIFIYILHVD